MLRRYILIISAICLSSCGDGIERGSKAVYPVTGKITVDGKAPGEVIQIKVHDDQQVGSDDYSESWANTQNDGSFALNTYNSGDGVPVGNYTLTFTWKQFNAMSMSYGGPDKLSGRYDDPEKSDIKFTVDGSGPVDLGTIDLTTQ